MSEPLTGRALDAAVCELLEPKPDCSLDAGIGELSKGHWWFRTSLGDWTLNYEPSKWLDEALLGIHAKRLGGSH